MMAAHLGSNKGFIYSIAGCVTGQSGNSRSCHSHEAIIGVKAMYIFR